MAQIQTTEIFADGQTVNAARLNNVIVAASALAGIISEQGAPVTPANTDQVLLLRPGSPGVLHRANVSGLPSGVTDVNAAASPAFINLVATTPSAGVRLLTLSFDAQNQNKVLAAPADGTLNTPSFRALVPQDTVVPTSAIAALLIDWSLGNVFDKTLTATSNTFTFSNVTDGQTIRVRIRQTAAGTATVSWNPGTLTLFWCDGVTPALTTTPNGYGIFVFTAVVAGGVTRIHGFLEQVPAHTVLNDNQAKNTFLAGPVSGSNAIPAFRAVVQADLPVLNDNQTKNTFLAGPVSGSNAIPAFRAVVPADTASFTDVSLHIIDLTLDNVFQKVLHGTGVEALKINNGAPGQRVTIYIRQGDAGGARTVTWDSDDPGKVIRWPGGVNHTMTTGVIGDTDIVNFLCMGGGLYYGTFNKDFTP